MSEPKVKIGVFGAGRGCGYINIIQKHPRAELIAICDRRFDILKKDAGLHFELGDTPVLADFDEFLEYGKAHGMNAVLLCNYFHQHAPYAIKAMNAGMDVISECTSAMTLKECVELVETTERTGRKYMITENYPFSTRNLKMEQIIQQKMLGTLLYAEGEYNHSCTKEDHFYLAPTPYHWRRCIPSTYYVTHSLGPIMYMTKTMPKYVSARSVSSELRKELMPEFRNTDGAGMMFCEMDNGMIARFTGCTSMISDYSRYRVCGDKAGVEWGGYLGPEEVVRMLWFTPTMPADEDSASKLIHPKMEDFGEIGRNAVNSGHGGGDYWMIANMVKYFLDDEVPFFDVYKGVAMSATAILGWRSCLNHGENFRIPDFHDPADRDTVRNDDLTPIPDENGNGATLPSALPIPE